MSIKINREILSFRNRNTDRIRNIFQNFDGFTFSNMLNCFRQSCIRNAINSCHICLFKLVITNPCRTGFIHLKISSFSIDSNLNITGTKAVILSNIH